MKKVIILVSLLFAVLCLSAQTKPMIEILHNRGIYQIPADEVDEIIIEEEEEVEGAALWKFMDSHPEYSLFREAMSVTNVASRLNLKPEDYSYVKDEMDYDGYRLWDKYIEVPEKRKLCYTCFIEPNSVYEKEVPGIKNATKMQDALKLLQEYVLESFCEAYSDYPEEVEAARNGVYPLDDERNYFNRFVAYHFINKKIEKIDFTRYSIGMEPAYARLKEYAETLSPGQMIYMSAGMHGNSLRDPNLLQLNPSPDNEALSRENKDWTYPSKDGVFLSPLSSMIVGNGFFHAIEKILMYPRKDFMKMRFRFDAFSLFPEVMSNDLRYKYETQGRIVFPKGYLSNIKMHSSGTILLMISPNKDATRGYSTYQGDELAVYNTYDFVLRLPPVPAGIYEVRLGLATGSAGGYAQFYLGTNEDELLPCGIPVDLTRVANEYGWVDDRGTEEDYESDLFMRHKGWMKGPDSWLCCNGNKNRSLRATENTNGTGYAPLRCIIGRINLVNDGCIYLRARNAGSYDKVEFLLDYLELCPATIYDNPLKPEPRD